MDTLEEKRGTLYVNCGAGIAGDMFLASLLDITGDEEYLKSELAKLPLFGYRLKLFRSSRGGLSGLRFEVETDETHSHRNLADIKKIIRGGGLADKVKEETLRAFTILAEAEGKVHGMAAGEVHFHEVGAVDSIIDLTGVMIMLSRLGWPEVIFSPLNIGSGTVRCAHGTLPVPAPAVAELLQGISVFSEGEPMERVTPTGAALVRALGAKISPSMPRGRIKKTGVGLGARDSALPNALRSVLVENDAAAAGEPEVCCELCANIDDMTPQDLSAAMELLFEAGALDVWFEAIQMKKNRPAVKLCCLGTQETRDSLAAIFLSATTTLGVRFHNCERYVLKRRTDSFRTPLGEVRVKSAVTREGVIKQMPEFEDVLRLSKEHGIPVTAVREILAERDFLAGSGEVGEKRARDAEPGEEPICLPHHHNHATEHAHENVHEGGEPSDRESSTP